MSTTQLPSEKYQRRKTSQIALPNHHHLLLGGSLCTLAQTTSVQYCQNFEPLIASPWDCRENFHKVTLWKWPFHQCQPNQNKIECGLNLVSATHNISDHQRWHWQALTRYHYSSLSTLIPDSGFRQEFNLLNFGETNQQKLCMHLSFPEAMVKLI